MPECILGRLQAEDISEACSASIGEELKELFRHRNAIDAEIQRRVHRLDKTRAFESDGSLTAKAWLRSNCHLTHAAASDRVEVARQMQALPLTTRALADGDISYRHAALIARTAQRLGREVDPGRLRLATMQLRYCLEPGGVLDDANEEDERRFLNLSQTFGGIFVLNGQLGADDGATLTAALMSVLRPQAQDDERSPQQRRADALVELARRQPARERRKPHVAVSVEMSTLAQEPGSPAAELEWSNTPIHGETARRIACDCSAPRSSTASRTRPRASCRAPCGGRWWRETSTAGSPAATCRRRARASHPALGRWRADQAVQPGPDVCRRHHRQVHEGRCRLVEMGDGLLQAVPP